ncbi:MAG TPA: glycoside hydrolase family 2 TIM barrel-domain containing protein, partial [Anaerolineales bacterium]|nr:glycoside hydrolase family 2 TIM barrel-domain containing protein [Anaerolineales bacterium]
MSLRTRLSLDGQWYFSPTEIPPTDNPSLIAVPSPWQAEERFRHHVGTAWYQRDFDLPAGWFSPERVILLGVGAVDYFAEVWLNGIKVGEHEGGYLPFELDVTGAARPGANRLTVRVDDPPEVFPEIPHGKQSWYGMLSGIWQPVWVETRAGTHIQRAKISTSGEQVSVEVIGRGEFAAGLRAEVIAPDGKIAARDEFKMPHFSLWIERPLAWSPEEPNLYTLKVSTRDDELTEIFGFRTIETRAGKILLNGRPFYLRGALDQDYYPDLIATPPSQEYVEEQFRKAKEMGLNCLRIHIKVPDPRYYAAADKVGLLIWTELPNHSLLTENAKRRARETLAGMIERDGNHPSIGIWTIINEGWGIDLTDPDQRAWLAEMYAWLKELDPTRLVVENSACWGNFHVATDIADFHIYYAMPDHHEQWREWTEQYARRPWWLFAHEYKDHASWHEFHKDPWHTGERPPAPDVRPRGDEPLLVSEFGNWGLPDVEKLQAGNGGTAPWWFDTGLEWGDGIVYPHGIEQRFRAYHLDRVFPSLAALTEASQRLQYDALKFEIENIRSHASIQGYVITEFTDLHWESNGLLDMYRAPKVHFSLLRKFNVDDVLIPVWERLAYSSGETCEMKILFSHYSAAEIKEARLKWKVESGRSSTSGELSIVKCASFGVTDLGAVVFEAPQVERPAKAILKLDLISGGNVIASNEQEIYVFPMIASPELSRARASRLQAKLQEEPASKGVFALEFHPVLRRLGYRIVDGLSQADLAVVSTLDDPCREFVLQGGRVLFLAESDNALQT